MRGEEGEERLEEEDLPVLVSSLDEAWVARTMTTSREVDIKVTAVFMAVMLDAVIWSSRRTLTSSVSVCVPRRWVPPGSRRLCLSALEGRGNLHQWGGGLKINKSGTSLAAQKSRAQARAAHAGHAILKGRWPRCPNATR